MDQLAFDVALLDGIASALLAAAATCRARSMGAHLTGAIVLGCLCGLIGPLLRESFIRGSAGTRMAAAELPDDVLIGCLGAIASLYLLRKRTWQLFFWLDSAGIALGSSIGAMLSLDMVGIVGAISIGLVNGLAPGLVRDMALGDTAMLVEQDWYATAAAIGCVVTISVFLWLVIGWINSWTAAHAEVTAICSGCAAMLIIRGWKGKLTG